MNLYAYVGNDPVNHFDPTGEAGVCVTISCGGRTATLQITPGGRTRTVSLGNSNRFTSARGDAFTNAVEGAVLLGNDSLNPLADVAAFAEKPSAGTLIIAAGTFPGPNLLKGADKIIPGKAVETLANVRNTGKAPDGHVGGRTFQNREGRLPQDGNCREYDVDPKPASGSRNAERLVVDQDTGRAFYTPDHYETFQEIEY